ncbi:uncharacterized protein G6M90_00g067300 [Metarhizium brunneum]|uniref:Uncharacterized protein n=1 Tax=Metarhizium brunneum TaxID=500148 RepID=A0A7D5UZV3_9HYPO|nr:hypothetical protein G6M90_00g067300 [Metarhizium brunneum]
MAYIAGLTCSLLPVYNWVGFKLSLKRILKGKKAAKEFIL